MGKRPMTVRIARWSAEHPWRAIALWVVFVAVCFVGGNAAGLTEMTDEDMRIGEMGHAQAIIADGDFAHPAQENVLITARSGALDSAAAGAAATDAATRLRSTPGVAAVGQPVPSRDGSALLLPITMSGDRSTASERVQPLRDATAAVQTAHPQLRVEQVGGPSISRALDETIGEDFTRAEFLSIPVTLAILVIAFGALIAAGIPVLLALSSVAAAMGLSTIASHLVPANDSSASVILLIGMAVGVDYSLFYVRREREERAKGRRHLDAVEMAAETSGHAVVVSGLAVIISMAGLFLANDPIFASFAVGSILVVAVAVIGSLTVLPAVLAKLGRWIDKPRVPLLWRLTAHRVGPDGAPVPPRFWPAVLRPALRHPRTTLVISAGLLLALAVPAIDMKLKFPGPEDLPRSTAVMQAYDRLTAAFPSTGTTHTVAVRADAAQAGAVRTALTDLATRAAADPLFAPIEANGPQLEVSADRRVATLEIATPYATRTDEARRSLQALRADLVPATLREIPGVEYAVTGAVAESEDYAAHIREKLPLVVGFVLLLTFVAMTITFRSLVVALTSIVLNLLSAGAAYGLLVLVFQNTWAEGLLGFTSMGAIVSWLPLFLFVILFGLSMDYHVFVVSRIREAVRGGMPNREAVAHGITSSAGVVSSAAIVMVAVFAIFGTLSAIEMKQIGVGLAAAILIDATIIRAVVLPSLMTLLGKANWWAPRFLRERPAPVVDVAAPTPEPELVGAR
ncbi:putative drug exporter of the RND superfamily [Micromonospora pattaloongensis]|uniref:Putative drug exporter of the RND superfamily n=1 Tax=Micromonospora pattaloongensis TaxID=405436 RepID=A0A1H3KTX7_9ACTN|nr:MMPL family transporter [Micromonospora pattaloongensis]SDY55114.1 putative drug exporter of the RND superfamily [Micromonospora pattaloongensis]